MKRSLLIGTFILSVALAASCGGGDGEVTEPEVQSGTAEPRTEQPVVSSSPGEFTRVEDMKSLRESPGTVTLEDGRVLVTGGRGRGGGGFWLNYETTTEIFDPATGKWTLTGETNMAHAAAPTIVLADGRVLTAGGEGEQNVPINSSEIWDPTTGTWTETGPLNEARDLTDPVLLPDGRVLVAGGRAEGLGLMDSVEIFDPETNEWTLVSPMNERRMEHTTTLLDDGRVLVTGGGKVDPAVL